MPFLTYAVSWSTPAGAPCVGCLGLGARVLSLTGISKGKPVEQKIAFDEIDDVRLESGLLQVTERDGRLLAIRSLDAPGALRELAERLVTIAAGPRD